jgi:Sulfotransferase domain
MSRISLGHHAKTPAQTTTYLAHKRERKGMANVRGRSAGGQVPVLLRCLIIAISISMVSFSIHTLLTQDLASLRANNGDYHRLRVVDHVEIDLVVEKAVNKVVAQVLQRIEAHAGDVFREHLEERMVNIARQHVSELAKQFALLNETVFGENFEDKYAADEAADAELEPEIMLTDEVATVFREDSEDEYADDEEIDAALEHNIVLTDEGDAVFGEEFEDEYAADEEIDAELEQDMSDDDDEDEDDDSVDEQSTATNGDVNEHKAVDQVDGPIEERKPRIPNVLIGGVQKGGTTSLSRYFKDNLGGCFSADVPGSEMEGKEPHFFDNMFSKGIGYYREVFAECQNSTFIIDGTPETMLRPEKVRQIYEEQGTADQVKIIFSLREPVDRELSWYNHRAGMALLPNAPAYAQTLLKEDGTLKTFKEDIKDRVFAKFRLNQYDYLYGLYASLLKRWFAVFDRHQILVLSYDEIKANETAYLERIHNFLDVPITKPLKLGKENVSVHRHEATTKLCAFEKFLSATFFDQPNEELYQLLEDVPGPAMEQRPFPKFEINC